LPTPSGEFNSAAIGTRIGARRLLLVGMAVSAGRTWRSALPTTAGRSWLHVMNGFAQATGWSGNVGTMAHWFKREERGRVMAGGRPATRWAR